MAEEKEEKDEKTSEEKFKQVIAEIIAIALLVFFFVPYLIFQFTAGGSGSTGISGFFNRLGVMFLLGDTISVFVIFSTLLSALFIWGIIYSLIQLRHLEAEWHASLYPEPEGPAAEQPKNERWERVVEHSTSGNPGDWRLAILECDIILDELLDKLGYVGGTIGDKLKNVDSAHFRTLNDAWEAHKIRNAIAHEGQDFTLTDREARRIVSLYENVFREFDFI